MPTQNLNPDYQQHVRKLDSIVTRDLGFVTIIDISSNRKPFTPNQVDRSDEVSARERMISRLRRDDRGKLQTANGCNAEIRYDQKLMPHASNSDLTDRVRENLQRDLMVSRLRKGRHFMMPERSEAEARELYISRLKSRKR